MAKKQIDRSIVEKIRSINDLIRNTISHGIENSSERIQKGKMLPGKINLKAYNKEAMYIEISDDESGMNIKNIYEKALKKLNLSEHVYSESEIINLYFYWIFYS